MTEFRFRANNNESVPIKATILIQWTFFVQSDPYMLFCNQSVDLLKGSCSDSHTWTNLFQTPGVDKQGFQLFHRPVTASLICLFFPSFTSLWHCCKTRPLAVPAACFCFSQPLDLMDSWSFSLHPYLIPFVSKSFYGPVLKPLLWIPRTSIQLNSPTEVFVLLYFLFFNNHLTLDRSLVQFCIPCTVNAISSAAAN